MGGEWNNLSPAEAASLLGWWVEAGVDTAVSEEARQWLAAAATSPSGATPVEPSGGPPAVMSRTSDTLPDTLEAFHSWLGSQPGLPLASPGMRAALPHGPANAEIMIVADAPEADDADRPVGGDSFVLMTRMLMAVGIAPENAYVAALSCYPNMGRRLDRAALDHCRELVLHQIGLVAPKRLLLLGDGPSRAVTGLPAAQARGKVHRIKGIQAVVSFHPRWLLQRPTDKARAWDDLLLLMGEKN